MSRGNGMNHRVGIWIDYKKAVIVSAAAGLVTAMTLESNVGPQARNSIRYVHLDRYYDEIIGHLGQPDELLIFGPGEAKLQLNERLSRSKALSACIVNIETTDTLTDPQIVAKVRTHYEIAFPAGSAVRPGTSRSGAQ